MFRSIGSTLDQKRREIIKTEKKGSDVSFVFNKFLNEYFFEYKNLFEWKASYSPKDGKVVINIGSKLIAGELSLKIRELSRLFKEANLRVTQVIIV